MAHFLACDRASHEAVLKRGLIAERGIALPRLLITGNEKDVMRLDRKTDEYNRRIVTEIKSSGTTLTRVYGVGPISAAVILG